MVRRYLAGLCVAPLLLLGLSACGGDSFETAGSDGGTGPGTGSDSGTEAGPDAQPDVSGGGLRIQPDGYVFSGVAPGTVSDPFPFSVVNDATEASGPIGAVVDNDLFRIVENDCSTLAAGASCTISVSFEAGELPSVTGRLVVNADPGGEASAQLTGQLGGVVEGISITPSSHDFGAVRTGEQASEHFVVRNVGTQTLPSVDVFLEVPEPAFVIADNDCVGELIPEATCKVTVEFAPLDTDPGVKSSTLVASSGSSQGTAQLHGHSKDLFVSIDGDDAADGLSLNTSLRTITQALDRGDAGWTVHVAPGTYGQGENFPLKVMDMRIFGKDGDRPILQGPPSPDSLLVELAGDYPEIHSFVIEAPAGAGAEDAAVVLAKPNMAAVVGNVEIQFSANWTGLVVDVGSFAAAEVFSTDVVCDDTAAGGNRGIAVRGGGDVSLQYLTFRTCGAGLTVDGPASVFLRDTEFWENRHDGIHVTDSGASLNLGVWTGTTSSSEPGGNSFVTGHTSFVALNVAVPNTVLAYGNTWIPQKQGANAQGLFTPGFEASGTDVPPATGGPWNFSLGTDDSVIQF